MPCDTMNCIQTDSEHLNPLTLLGFGPFRSKKGEIKKNGEIKKVADKSGAFKILSDNRQAGHNYFLMDRFEAGLVLTGTEVKAAKSGKIQLRESYATIDKNEAWLVNAHISEYSHGNRENHSPVRSRKLLLHRREIDKLLGKTREKGLSLIPTKIYLKGG